MGRYRHAPWVFVIALLTSCVSTSTGSTSTTTPPASTPPPSSTTSLPIITTTTLPDPCADQIPESIRESIRQEVDSGNSVGIVAGIVSACGQQVYAYGQPSLDGGRALDQDTVFEIGSTGKAFTGILLADQVQNDYLALSDPLDLYLPEDVDTPTFDGRSITLLDLALHTSGLPPIPSNLEPQDELNPYADYTFTQMYEELGSIELTRPIGSEYEYSNFGMGVLGHILELRIGWTYEEIVLHRIAEVLGMPDTRSTLTSDMQDRLATGYRGTDAFPLWDNPTLAGAGNLRTTVRDLLTFLTANLGLQQTSLHDAMQLSHQRFFRVNQDLAVGLGWHITTQPFGDVVEAHGATGGYWCFLGFLEDPQVGVVVLTNTYNDVDPIGINLIATSLSSS